MDDNLMWNNHFQHVSKKISSYLWLLSKIKSFIMQSCSIKDRSTDRIKLIYRPYKADGVNKSNIIRG